MFQRLPPQKSNRETYADIEERARIAELDRFETGLFDRFLRDVAGVTYSEPASILSLLHYVSQNGLSLYAQNGNTVICYAHNVLRAGYTPLEVAMYMLTRATRLYKNGNYLNETRQQLRTRKVIFISKELHNNCPLYRRATRAELAALTSEL